MKACTSCPLLELRPSSLLRELGNISRRLRARVWSPCSHLLTRTPFSGGGEHTPTIRISSQSSTTQPKDSGWVPGQQKGRNQAPHTRRRPCPPPSLPAATTSPGQQDRPLRCLAVTAAKLTPHAGRSCPGARVSARCTGYSALPYGVRLPSRAINTTAGRKQQQKALKPSLPCLGKSSLGWGCPSLPRQSSGQG